MLDVYYARSPNGMKLPLFLEELAELGIDLPHRLIPVRLSAGEQFRPDFLAISPNNKIPAIVDHDPVDGGPPLPVFESAAILQYLGESIQVDVLAHLDQRQLDDLGALRLQAVAPIDGLAGGAGDDDTASGK